MSRWRKFGVALLGAIGSMSLAGSAHAADVAREAQPVTPNPRLERWARMELGLRMGFGIPFGEVTRSDGDLKELISGQVPIWVDLGARIDGHVSFGVYYSYGFGLLGSHLRETCDLLRTTGVDVSCYIRNHRVGLELGYHFLPNGDFDPWIAGGVGHELLDFTLSTASNSGSATSLIDADGMEYLNVQTGLDYRLGEHFRAGPFLAITVTTYGELTRSCHGDCGIEGSSSGGVRSGASHAWLFLGLRGAVLY